MFGMMAMVTSCTNLSNLQSFYNGKIASSAATVSQSSSNSGFRSVSLNLNNNLQVDLDTSLKLKLKLKLKSPRRDTSRKSPPVGTVWNLVGMSPDGTRYASAFDSSGNASVSLPTNKILSLYVEEAYPGYTNAMLLSYPDGNLTFRNGPSTSGTMDPIALGTPTVTNGLCTAPVQPDSNICTTGSGKPDAAVFTNMNGMDRYGSGVLDIYPVLDANQDGIPDAFEIGAGMLPKPALDNNGNIGTYSATNTNSPAVVLALTVDPNTSAYTNAPAWTNAQVRFALDPAMENLCTNYFSDWSNSVVTVAINPGFQSFVTPVLVSNWSNAAAAVTLLPAFTNLINPGQIGAFSNLQTAVASNTNWAAQSNTLVINTSAASASSAFASSSSASSSTGGSAIPTNGLAGQWLFSGNANDTSGNGNNGTVNGAMLTNDRFGNANCAYWFNGNGNYIQRAGEITPPASNFTWALWYNALTIPASGACLLEQGGDPGAHGDTRSISMNPDGSLDFYMYNTNGSVNVFTPDKFVSNQWYFVVGVYNGNTSSIYVNGNLEATSNFNLGCYPEDDFYIGGDVAYNANYFCGAIDDVRVYNRALSSSEISALYNEGGWTGNSSSSATSSASSSSSAVASSSSSSATGITN